MIPAKPLIPAPLWLAIAMALPPSVNELFLGTALKARTPGHGELVTYNYWVRTMGHVEPGTNTYRARGMETGGH
jgi:hypothetical protein